MPRRKIRGWRLLGRFRDEADWEHLVCGQVMQMPIGATGVPEFCTYCGLDERENEEDPNGEL